VFVLSELEEMTAPEISAALGVNLNTVYSRLRAARRDFDAALVRHRLRNPQ
jgi:RNA polymerase sigma-70 factor (ECF subfamily)